MTDWLKTLFHGGFESFWNCTNCTKSRKVPRIVIWNIAHGRDEEERVINEDVLKKRILMLERILQGLATASK